MKRWISSSTWSRLDGDSREPLIKAADIYRKRKDWASLARMLERSIYIHPYDMKTQKKLGEACSRSGDWEPAIAAYRALVGLNPSDPAGAHYDLAAAFLASGNMQEAKRETLRALEIAPSFSKAQRLLLKLSGATNDRMTNWQRRPTRGSSFLSVRAIVPSRLLCPLAFLLYLGAQERQEAPAQ